MRKSLYLMCFIIAAVTSVSCSNKASNDNTITISGAFALYPLTVKWAEEFKKDNPEIVIDISAGGAGKGMTDVLMGMCDIAMVSREVYSQEIEKGAVPFTVAKDGVVAIVNSNNPIINDIKRRGLNRQDAHKIWIDEKVKDWSDIYGGEKVELHAYTRSDACGAAETWAVWLGETQEDLMGVKVFGDPGIVAAVQSDQYGVGFANIAYAYDEQTKRPYDGTVVIPIDINGDGVIDDNENVCNTKPEIVSAIESGAYPAPPGRDLYFITNGKPTKEAVRKFINYVLTEGQKENSPAGYVKASLESVATSLKHLEIE